MNEREVIVSLTRVAFLDAIILSLLSVQSVMPFVFLMLLWLIPLVFALEIYLVPIRVVWISALVVSVLALALLGVSIGFWAVVYVTLGITLGTCRRFRLPWFVRSISLGLACAVAMAVVFLIFGKLSQTSWQEVVVILEDVDRISYVPIIPALTAGFLLWVIMLSVSMDWFFWRLLRQMSIEI